MRSGVAVSRLWHTPHHPPTSAGCADGCQFDPQARLGSAHFVSARLRVIGQTRSCARDRRDVIQSFGAFSPRPASHPYDAHRCTPEQSRPAYCHRPSSNGVSAHSRDTGAQVRIARWKRADHTTTPTLCKPQSAQRFAHESGTQSALLRCELGAQRHIQPSGRIAVRSNAPRCALHMRTAAH